MTFSNVYGVAHAHDRVAYLTTWFGGRTYMKLCGLYLIFLIDQTHVLYWYIARLAVKIDTCGDETGFVLKTNLDLILNKFEGVHVIT